MIHTNAQNTRRRGGEIDPLQAFQNSIGYAIDKLSRMIKIHVFMGENPPRVNVENWISQVAEEWGYSNDYAREICRTCCRAGRVLWERRIDGAIMVYLPDHA